jgi:hypothetical protein
MLPERVGDRSHAIAKEGIILLDIGDGEPVPSWLLRHEFEVEPVAVSLRVDVVLQKESELPG